MESKRKKTDLMAAILLLAFAGFMWVLISIYVSTTSGPHELSAAFFPRVFVLSVGGLSVLLALNTLRDPPKKEDTLTFPWPVVLVATLSFLYTFAMNLIGFFISTALFLWVMMAAMGEKRRTCLALVALITPAIIMAIFEKVMFILFPRGILWP